MTGHNAAAKLRVVECQYDVIQCSGDSSGSSSGKSCSKMS